MTGLFICAEYLFEKKEERTHYFLFRLGAGTLASAAVSAFIVIPQLLQTFVSARFENENSGGLLMQYLAILRQVTGAYTTRWWSLLGLSFAAALIVCGLVKFRKEKKTVFLVCSAVLMMVLELFFESVNLMWHFGSYIQYPIRNGFMIYTVIASCACYYAGRLFPKEERGLFCGKKKQILKAGAGLAVTAILAGIGIMLYRAHPGLQLRIVFHTTSIVMAAAFFLYLSFFVWKSGKYKYYSVFLLMAELIFYTFLLLGKPSFITGYSEEPEQGGEYIRICNQLAGDFSIEPDYLARVKNPDESLNANYGLILRRPALSNWTHLISPELQQGAGAWGYSWQFTRLLDAGGTAFSDALLGVTETISCLVQDPALYEKKASAEVVVDHTSGRQDTYTLYQNQYTLPWGLTAAQADMVSKWMGTDLADTDADIVSLQNSLYRALAKESGSGEIACWIKNGDDLNQNSAVSDEEKTDGLVNTETVIIQVQDMTALYFQGGGADREDKNTEIFVNGEPAAVPSIKETDNTLYPAHFNNNAICLGTFENEQVTVEIKTDLSVTDKSETQISALDIGKLGELCKSYQNYDTKVSAGKHSLSAQIYAEEDGEFLLLPLAYDDGWNVRVNQKTVQASSYAGIFTAIPLEKGDNEVTMTYLPKGMKQGLLLTAGTLLALFTAMLFRLKRPGVRKPEGSFMEPVY
ncbi:MAG TPA: YfhO family protein, partial [Lachnospiraceae bacterium]|nr:YfhO family protein [Lachnospiraceae bacterium]